MSVHFFSGGERNLEDKKIWSVSSSVRTRRGEIQHCQQIGYMNAENDEKKTARKRRKRTFFINQFPLSSSSYAVVVSWEQKERGRDPTKLGNSF